MNFQLHEDDLPSDFAPGTSIAVDTEAMGLRNGRDRLCLVQVSTGDGEAHLVRVAREPAPAPNLMRILGNEHILKLYHFARFDVRILYRTFAVMAAPIYCTKIASTFARTYGDRHSLGELTRDLLGVKLPKQEQSTDWGHPELTERQLRYAADDVLYLHKLKAALDMMLAREGRDHLAQRCFEFLPSRVQIDLAGWERTDIFAHDADQNA